MLSSKDPARPPWQVVGHVALCRSRTTGRPFGIRFRKEGRRWLADHSFTLENGEAGREGFGETVGLRGLLDYDASYPGCPDNEDRLIFKCYCGRLTIWDMALGWTAVCRWCGYEGACVPGARDLDTCGDL